MPFVHLHTHSEYSLLDGANRIPDLLDRVQALGMDSLAITDHGNLHGAWSFYAEAKARKIRPILGFEAYLAFGSRHSREKPSADAPLGSAYSHLVLLAKNRAGYQNLIKLSSIGFLEGYYRRPRIDKEVLERHQVRPHVRAERLLAGSPEPRDRRRENRHGRDVPHRHRAGPARRGDQ